MSWAAVPRSLNSEGLFNRSGGEWSRQNLHKLVAWPTNRLSRCSINCVNGPGSSVTRSRNQATSDKAAAVRKLHAAGESVSAISRTTGLSRPTIYSVLDT